MGVAEKGFINGAYNEYEEVPKFGVWLTPLKIDIINRPAITVSILFRKNVCPARSIS